MKIVIPSYNRAQTIKTHLIFEKANFHGYQILLHNEGQRAEYIKNPTIDPSKIIITGEPKGVANQRRWIAKNLVPAKEWYLTLDDNISHFSGVPDPFYHCAELPVHDRNFKRQLFDYELPLSEFLNKLDQDIQHCEKVGAYFSGFATVPNHYFRGKKYRYVGYVISKAALIKNVGVPYDPMLEAMEDYGFTAENLLTFGKVLINNFLMPVAGHYEQGGIGTYEQRLPRKIKDCEYLMQKYPGLFRFKVKAGCHPRAELQIRFTSTKQVLNWREMMLGLCK